MGCASAEAARARTAIEYFILTEISSVLTKNTRGVED